MDIPFEFCMTMKDYKQFFKPDTTLQAKLNNDELVYLEIALLNNETNRKNEYSIEWYNELSNEGGEMHHIHSDSRFSFVSRRWGH